MVVVGRSEALFDDVRGEFVLREREHFFLQLLDDPPSVIVSAVL